MLIKQVKSTVLSPVHTKNVNYKDNYISVHTNIHTFRVKENFNEEFTKNVKLAENIVILRPFKM